MAYFSLTPEEVNVVLGDIETTIKESNSIMEELDEVMSTLGMCWEGEAYSSYLATYNRYKETHFLMQAYLKAYGEAIRAILIAPMPPVPTVRFNFGV